MPSLVMEISRLVAFPEELGGVLEHAGRNIEAARGQCGRRLESEPGGACPQRMQRRGLELVAADRRIDDQRSCGEPAIGHWP